LATLIAPAIEKSNPLSEAPDVLINVIMRVQNPPAAARLDWLNSDSPSVLTGI
jgi:hypothetical protein